jgi:hypothetical protein
VLAVWVAGDEVYGADPRLRAELERRGIGYVLAMACDHRVVAAGDTYRADALLGRVPARAWQFVSAGRGAKGHRLYDWAFIRLDDGDSSPGGQAGQRWLLVRRNLKTRELAFYHCWTPGPVALATLVRVAGRRWTIEERFQTGKGLCGLDSHQVRRWRSWYRWVTLAMFAHAFLVVAALTEHTRHLPPSGLIGPQPPAALVALATPTSSPRPHLPLPPTSQWTMILCTNAAIRCGVRSIGGGSEPGDQRWPHLRAQRVALGIGQSQPCNQAPGLHRGIEHVRADGVEQQLCPPEQGEDACCIHGAPGQVDEPASGTALDVRPPDVDTSRPRDRGALQRPHR